MTHPRPLPRALAAVAALALLPGLALAQSAGTGSTPVPPREIPAGAGTSNDAKTFAEEASRSDLFEIESSRIAIDKASSAEAKDYARRMMQEHARTTSELKIILSTSNMPSSAPDLDPRRKAIIDRLSALSGPEFDRAYMDAQRQSHEETLALMEDYAKNGDEPKLKAYAQKTSSIVRGHLEQAKLGHHH